MAKIEKTPSGKYRTRVYLGRDETGRKITKLLTDTDKARLRRRAAEYQATHAGLTAVRDSFETAALAYIGARESVLSPTTIAGYRSILRTILLRSGMGRKKITDITETDVRLLINALSGLSPKTLRNIVGFVSAVLDFHGLTAPSARLPARVIPDRDIPSADDVAAIVAAARGTRWEIPLELAIMGLRRSEICGLRIMDLDGDGVLHVHRVAVYDSQSRLVYKDVPKNTSSDRYIQLPDALAQKIRAQGYITDMTPAAMTASFPHLLRSHGLPPMRLHDCRHFMASYLHMQGVPDAEIMRMGGWKTDHIMKTVYRHALAQEETAQKVRAMYDDLIG